VWHVRRDGGGKSRAELIAGSGVGEATRGTAAVAAALDAAHAEPGPAGMVRDHRADAAALETANRADPDHDGHWTGDTVGGDTADAVLPGEDATDLRPLDERAAPDTDAPPTAAAPDTDAPADPPAARR
jgi:hypothetical protein